MTSLSFRGLLIGLTIAIIGTALHDTVEFGAPSIQNTLPFAVLAGGLLIVWHQWAGLARAARTTLLGLVLLFLIGGGVLSVLPLAFWPWQPGQSVGHYLEHALWTASLGVFAYQVIKAIRGSSLAS